MRNFKHILEGNSTESHISKSFQLITIIVKLFSRWIIASIFTPVKSFHWKQIVRFRFEIKQSLMGIIILNNENFPRICSKLRRFQRNMDVIGTFSLDLSRSADNTFRTAQFSFHSKYSVEHGSLDALKIEYSIIDYGNTFKPYDERNAFIQWSILECKRCMNIYLESIEHNKL